MWSSGRHSLFVIVLASTGMLARPASAGDGGSPDPAAAEPAAEPTPAPCPDALAEAVVKALKEKDEAAIAEAIESLDCWLIVDAILARGDAASAAALAKYVVEASEGNTEFSQLPAYVESRRGKPDPPETRRAACSAEDALARGDTAAALAAAQVVGPGCDGVTGTRLWSARGKALLTLEQYPQAAKSLVTAADAARTAGWCFRALDLYQLAGNVAVDALDFETALFDW